MSQKPTRGRHFFVPPKNKRKGQIIVLAAVLMVVMMGMVAFGVDTGYMYTMQTRLQSAVDSAALAGAATLGDGEDEARDIALEFLVRNPIRPVDYDPMQNDVSSQINQYSSEHGTNLEITLGYWDEATKTFSSSGGVIPPSSVSIKMTHRNLPLFFARALGQDEFEVTAEAIATYQPRDIMLVLDYSRSMNFDSLYNSPLGVSHVRDNLQECWQDLGNPQYGNLPLEPEYITTTLNTNDHDKPDTTTEYRFTSAHITCESDIQEAYIWFQGGGSQGVYTGNSRSLTVQGTGYNNGREISQIRITTRHPDYWWVPSHTHFYYRNYNDLKNHLGISHVSYPYPGGSWNEYIDYVRHQSTYNAQYANDRYKFGHTNLLHYWIEWRSSHSDTPDLWKAGIQPVEAVKDSVDVFAELIETAGTNDQLGLSIYNSSSGNGLLEHALSKNYDQVRTTARQRQANHHHSATNIGAGLENALDEIEENGRAGSFKMVVLMTDGVPTWYNGSADEVGARNYLIQQAERARDMKIPVFAVSLGSGADTELMEQVAAITAGYHFTVEGGQSPEEYTEDLKDAFREIANKRPLRLVQ
ncbi:MAG: VWA domain-containing protein [Pirellulaceae bacterium]|nr:VWA domain-containing protein [Pirellulaceae bacterium]